MAVESSKPVGMRRKPRQARSRAKVNRILDVAEEMFVSEGYGATTTNAIAARAEVPIGSLYQFFNDKADILYALAERYQELFYERMMNQDTDIVQLPLAEYVEQTVDATDRFFADYPGYHAIFMQVQGTMPELDRLENALDARFIEGWALEFAERDPSLSKQDCEAIAFVLVKAIGTLLWLSLGQEPAFRTRLVAETKRLTLAYLQTYYS